MNRRKENANKGFSLVELIIVVAIMAVLVGVLAPQYLKYVEKTRTQKDESAAEEVRHAVEIAIADEKIYNDLDLAVASGADTDTATVTVKDVTEIAVAPAGTGLLKAELVSVLGTDKVDFTSSTHNGGTYTITITYTKSTGAVTVAGTF